MLHKSGDAFKVWSVS